MIEAIRRAVRPLAVRVQNMLARGELAGATDTEDTQQVQVLVLADEVRSRVQRLQEYGFTSVPIAGAYPCLLVCPFGDRAQAVVVAADDARYRPTGGAPGDVEMYDSRGNSVRMRSGELRVFAAADLEVEATVNANVTIGGACTVTIENVIPAAAATGPVVVTGTDGAVIPAGAALSGGGQNYSVESEAVISGGSAVVNVVADATGPAGNMGSGATLTFSSPPSGVDANATVDTAGLTGGADEAQGESTINVTGNLTINCTGVANVTAPTVNLGGAGGPAVARVGDPVAGGVIASGSTKVFAQ